MGLPLAFYDILMIVVLLLSTIIGAWKGMAWQVAAVCSLVVSGIVATRFGGNFAPWFGSSAPLNRYVAMLMTYLVCSAGIWLAFRLVAGVIDRVKLKEFDRQIGAIFGAAKGLLWCLVITFFAVTLSERTRQSVLGSNSGYYAAVILQRATPVLPPKIRDALGKYIEQFEQKLKQDAPAESTELAACFPDVQSRGGLLEAALAGGRRRDGTRPGQRELFSDRKRHEARYVNMKRPVFLGFERLSDRT